METNTKLVPGKDESKVNIIFAKSNKEKKTIKLIDIIYFGGIYLQTQNKFDMNELNQKKLIIELNKRLKITSTRVSKDDNNIDEHCDINSSREGID